MNRRNFIGNLLAAGAGFLILPPALTGSRIWRASAVTHYVAHRDLFTIYDSVSGNSWKVSTFAEIEQVFQEIPSGLFTPPMIREGRVIIPGVVAESGNPRPHIM